MQETESKSSNETLFGTDVAGTLLEQVQGYWRGFIEHLPNLVLVIILLLLTWGICRLLQKLLGRGLKSTRVRPALIDLAKTLTSVVLWILGLLIAMSVLFPSVKPSSILTALGVGGIAIGFAFKDIFENFLAGVMIMLRKPMRVGDYIECEGVKGKIEDIMIRDTYVRDLNGELVLVPNAELYKNPVRVCTERDMRRYDVTVGVSYDTNVDEAREVIRDAVEPLEKVAGDRPVEVFACEFNSSSIDFNVRWWASSSQLDMHESRDQVISAIKQALDTAGIEIPFPYRTLTFKEELGLRPEGEFRLENDESQRE